MAVFYKNVEAYVRTASMVYAAMQGRTELAELLITLFIFVTAPVSANLLAQAALHLKLPSKAPLPKDVARQAAYGRSPEVHKVWLEAQ